MARFRQVHTSFWQDPFIAKLTPEEKFFYLYLFTNPHVSQCGIYEIATVFVSVETGYNIETVNKLLKRFVNYGKIVYSVETDEICLVNFLKYNKIANENVRKCIRKELKKVKNKDLVNYLQDDDEDELLNPFRTRFEPVQNKCEVTKKKKKKKKKNNNNKNKDILSRSSKLDSAPLEKTDEQYKEKTDEIVNYLNQKTGKNYKKNAKKTTSFIKARMEEGFILDDFKKVIDNKCRDWLNDEKMDRYLRPETLFSNKFEGYLNEREVKSKIVRIQDKFTSEAFEPPGEDVLETDTSYFDAILEEEEAKKREGGGQ